MSILQTTELKKYYGAEPNITKHWMVLPSLLSVVSLLQLLELLEVENPLY